MTVTANPFQKASRSQLKARVALEGPTGAGKTWTALEWATVLADGGTIAVVDTERGSASLYSDRFDFDVLTWAPPYDPGKLADLLKTAAGHGYAVVLIDSLSHFWEGEGGTLDMVDAAASRSGGNQFAGWKVGTPALRHLVDTMLGLDAHLIATMRSKMEYVLDENDRGKKVPRKVGMAPVMRAGVEYEFTLVGDLDLEHRLTITKSRCDLLADQVVQPGRAAEAAEQFMAWLGQGEPLAARAVVDGLVARMDAVAPLELRKACKQAFKAEVGMPGSVRESQLAAAEALVARFEADGVAGEAPDVEGPSGTGPESAPVAAPSPPVSSDGGSVDAPPAATVGLSRSGEESTDASGPAAADDRTQTTHGVALSGPVTVDQLLAAAPHDPGNPGKQRLTVMRSARDVALALAQEVPASLEDLAADPTLAAAVLHDLAGGDAPPSPGVSPPVGSSRPDDGRLVATDVGGEADGSAGSPVDHAGKAPHDPAFAGEGVLPADPDVTPWKQSDLTAWGTWNRRCQAKARGTKAKPGVLDPDDTVREEQRHAMAHQASRGRVSSWADITQAEGRGIEDALDLLRDGLAVLTFGEHEEHGGWIVERTDVEVPA